MSSAELANMAHPQHGSSLTPAEVARILRLTPDTVRAWLREGWIPAQRVGKRWVIAADDVDLAVIQARRADSMLSVQNKHKDTSSGPTEPKEPRDLDDFRKRPRGTGSVRFDAKSNRWTGHIRLGGKQSFRRFKTPEEAHRWLDGLIAEHANAERRVGSMIDVSRQYLEATASQRTQPVQGNVTRTLAWAEQVFIDYQPHQWDRPAARRLALAVKNEDSWAPATQKLVWSRLVAMLMWAANEGIIQQAYTNRLGPVAVRATEHPAANTHADDDPKRKALKDHDFRVLVAYLTDLVCPGVSATLAMHHRACRARWQVALLGLRQGEALGLQWSDVELEGKHPAITVRRRAVRRKGGSWVVEGTKTGVKGQRIVPLPATVAEGLVAHRQMFSCQADEALGDDMLVWPSANDPRRPMSASEDSRAWSDIQKAAGLSKHYKVHALRHTAATRIVAISGNLRMAQEVLGHANIAQTAAYAHADAEGARATLELLFEDDADDGGDADSTNR